MPNAPRLLLGLLVLSLLVGGFLFLWLEPTSGGDGERGRKPGDDAALPAVNAGSKPSVGASRQRDDGDGEAPLDDLDEAGGARPRLRIRGRVQGLRNGVLVAVGGAQVAIQHDDLRHESLIAHTALDGRYELSVGVDAGPDDAVGLHAQAWAPGFAAERTSLSARLGTRDGVVEWDPVLVSGASFHGQALDAGGAPVEAVEVLWLPDRGMAHFAETDARGGYRIDTWVTGSGRLHARHERIGAGQPIAYTPPIDRIGAAPTLSLRTGGEIAGVLLDLDGQPITDARVTVASRALVEAITPDFEQAVQIGYPGTAKLVEAETAGLAYSRSRTEDRGYFQFRGLTPGSHRLVARTSTGWHAWTVATGQTELRLHAAHHELIVLLRRADGRPARSTPLLLQRVLADPDPDPQRARSRDGRARFAVEPEQDYLLSVSSPRSGASELDGPEVTATPLIERRLRLSSAESRREIEIEIEPVPAGILRIPPWESATLDDESLKWRLRSAASGVLTASGTANHRHGLTRPLPPGDHRLELEAELPRSHPQREEIRRRLDGLLESRGHPRAGSGFLSRAVAIGGWFVPHQRSIRIEAGLEYVVESRGPQGGLAVLWLLAPEGETERERVSGPRPLDPRAQESLVGALRGPGPRERPGRLIRLSHDLVDGRWRSVFVSENALDPGRWKWSLEPRGSAFQPFELAFDVRAAALCVQEHHLLRR